MSVKADVRPRLLPARLTRQLTFFASTAGSRHPQHPGGMLHGREGCAESSYREGASCRSLTILGADSELNVDRSLPLSQHWRLIGWGAVRRGVEYQVDDE